MARAPEGAERKLRGGNGCGAISPRRRTAEGGCPYMILLPFRVGVRRFGYSLAAGYGILEDAFAGGFWFCDVFPESLTRSGVKYRTMGIHWKRTISWCRALCLVLCGAPLWAQVAPGTAPSGTAPLFEASAGYVFMSTTSAGAPRVNLWGLDGNGVLQFTDRWGAMVDFMFARAGNVPGTGHSDRVISALIGPEFFLVDSYKGNVFVHALAGAALVDSALLASSTTEVHGYATHFSYAIGAGAELTVHGPFAVRFTGDYQRTKFVNAQLASVPQNNVRVSAGVVYRFGSR